MPAHSEIKGFKPNERDQKAFFNWWVSKVAVPGTVVLTTDGKFACQVRVDSLEQLTKGLEKQHGKSVQPGTKDEWYWDASAQYYDQIVKGFGARSLRLKWYELVCREQETTGFFPKGMPLYWISKSYRQLDMPWHALRAMMLAFVEDSIDDKGDPIRTERGAPSELHREYGIPLSKLRQYSKRIYQEHVKGGDLANYPEYYLGFLDDEWRVIAPSEYEADLFSVNPGYVERLWAKRGDKSGKALENLVAYLLSSIPGVERMKVKNLTRLGERDVVISTYRCRSTFMRRLGDYILVECKDKKKNKATLGEVAILSAKVDAGNLQSGILVSRHGISGGKQGTHASRERLKVFAKHGIGIIVLEDRHLQACVDGSNLIQILQDQYEALVLDRD